MPMLDCLPKKDWILEVGTRDGITPKPDGQATATPDLDAGPWEPTIQQIVSPQQLDDDWDGFGAEAPSRELLESAIGLAYTFFEKGVDPPHRVVPGVTGTVHFEWQDPDGTYTDVEIDRPLHAEVMCIEPGKPAKHWTLPTE